MKKYVEERYVEIAECMKKRKLYFTGESENIEEYDNVTICMYTDNRFFDDDDETSNYYYTDYAFCDVVYTLCKNKTFTVALELFKQKIDDIKETVRLEE